MNPSSDGPGGHGGGAAGATLGDAAPQGSPTPPRSRSRAADGLLAKLSTGGLSAVLAALAAYALWAGHVTAVVTERAIASSTLSDHYTAAAAAVAAQESLERKYRLEPGDSVRQRFERASQDMLEAMQRVRDAGLPQDAAVAEQVNLAYGPYREAILRLFDAVDRQDSDRVRQIDNDEADPRFERIEHLVVEAADNHHAAALKDLGALSTQQAFTAAATPAVFTIGLALVLMFGSVMRRTRRQLDGEREQAVHDSLHDELTGLPNRTLLADRFEQALRAGRRSGAMTALLLIDLDRFKEVNDTLGHHIGDRLLAQVGPRLSGPLRAADTVARLGGDEFAVVLPGVDSLASALDVAARLRAALSQPFLVDGAELDIDGSIGVVLSGMHGDDAATLLQRADVAMYQAKAQGRGVAVYAPDADLHTPQRLSLLGDLRRGIDRGELLLHYQPKLCVATGKVIGVEALVRWMHPERGMVPPDDFIPAAEHTGLIGPLTEYVLNAALAQVKAWADAGRRIPVAVNVSTRNLIDADFVAKVAAALTRHALDASMLQIEITESAVMLEPGRSTAVLRELHALGVHIAIDDFGAGYTSLAQLKDLPVSELKIDKSFILAINRKTEDALIVRSMIALGHSLHLTVVAEGVEDAQSAALLSDYGCDTLQGYHLCRPMAPERLDAWLHARSDGDVAATPSVAQLELSA